MSCGWRSAQLVGTPLHFDFDVEVIPADLRLKFTTRMDGICLGCGLYQDYFRFTLDEVRAFASFNKDETVSEGGFRVFPVPDEQVASFDANYMHQRLARWQEYFRRRRISPKRCLFLRPMFGASLEFAQQEWGSELVAAEVSQACKLMSQRRTPGVSFLDVGIHGCLQDELVDAGSFDAIFVFHTLVHCVDIHRELALLGRLLTPNGMVVLSQEIQMKPQNPFHNLFPTEPQLVRILGQHFGLVQRIDDCDPNPAAFITLHTARNDSPDFVAQL